jgi:hypothetical protein
VSWFSGSSRPWVTVVGICSSSSSSNGKPGTSAPPSLCEQRLFLQGGCNTSHT